jgi:outer membrane immunogenic protein
MKKILLSTTALFAMTAMAAAADLPARTVAPAPVPFVAPVFTWSGFYAGINGGYVWNETEVRLRGTTGLTAAQIAALPTRGSLDDEGFTIGGHVGGNVQFGVFVAGLEADIAYTDIGRSRSLAIPAGVFTPVGVGAGTLTLGSDLEFLGTVRGRVGLAFDRFMVYGTGGFAYGGVNDRYSTDFAGAAFDLSGGNDDDIRFGYAVGVGGEYAITNNLVLGVEYLYYDLGRENIRVGTAAQNADYRVTHTGDIIRGRLSFKF